MQRMGHASQEALRIAAQWVNGHDAASARVQLMDGQMGSRITSVRGTLLSFGWWPVAYHGEHGELYITTDDYMKANRNGRMIASPTTAGHTDAARQLAGRNGYRYTGESVTVNGRTYDKYSR